MAKKPNSNLPEGIHKLRLAAFQFLDDGRLSLNWEPMRKGFKPIRWTMAPGKDAYGALMMSLSLPYSPSAEDLRGAIGTVIEADVRTGSPGFMNLAKAIRNLGKSSPVFNGGNTVIEWKLAGDGDPSGVRP